MRLYYVPSRWISVIALALALCWVARMSLPLLEMAKVPLSVVVAASLILNLVVFFLILGFAVRVARPLWDSSATVDLGVLQQSPANIHDRVGRASSPTPRSPSTSGAASSHTTVTSAATLAERLDLLRKLREAGSITADEEAVARKKILDNC